MPALSRSPNSAPTPGTGFFGFKPVLIDRERVEAALARVELKKVRRAKLYAALTERFAVDLDVLAGLLGGAHSDTLA